MPTFPTASNKPLQKIEEKNKDYYNKLASDYQQQITEGKKIKMDEKNKHREKIAIKLVSSAYKKIEKLAKRGNFESIIYYDNYKSPEIMWWTNYIDIVNKSNEFNIPITIVKIYSCEIQTRSKIAFSWK